MADDGSAAKYPPSPVPSDRRLWPGELPFTAFGQFGEDSLDLRVFDQRTYWVDRTGTAHLLSQMSDAYIVNVINFLTELRDQYFADSMRRAFIQILGDQLLFDDPSDELLGIEAGGPAWSDLTAEQWLESTPLMRALRRRLTTSTGDPL